MQKFLRRFEVFFCAFILIGMSGMNSSGAATSKATVPGTPTILSVVGGVASASLKWKPPKSDGGKSIISYKVTIFPTRAVHVCKNSSSGCLVDIPNPEKPTSKSKSYPYYFTVAATNEVGTGPATDRTVSIIVRFPGTVVTSNTFRVPTATPTPSKTPIAQPSPPVSNPAITTFDGLYSGFADVNISINAAPATTTNYATTFTVLNGKGSGSADNWTVTGTVTDIKGVASVTASNSTYGSLTFIVNFVQDPVTHVMTGSGKGERTETLPVIGEVKVDFTYRVSRQP